MLLVESRVILAAHKSQASVDGDVRDRSLAVFVAEVGDVGKRGLRIAVRH